MCGSFCKSKKFLNVAWTSLCTIGTIATSIWQLNNYIHGEDLTVVSYRTFHQDKKDVYPSIGLCFANTLLEEKLKNYHFTDPTKSDWSTSKLKNLYTNFLAGGYWDQDMLSINYDDVTKNIGDYVIFYSVMTNEYDKDYVIYNASEGSIHNSQTEATQIFTTRQQRPRIPHVKEFSFWTDRCVSIDIP